MADFCNNFGDDAFKGVALDDVLRFSSVAVTLALGDLPREDDVFEVKDREAVIFEFICCMGRDGLAERPDELADVGNGRDGHAQVYEERGEGGFAAAW